MWVKTTRFNGSLIRTIPNWMSLVKKEQETLVEKYCFTGNRTDGLANVEKDDNAKKDNTNLDTDGVGLEVANTDMLRSTNSSNSGEPENVLFILCS